MGTEGEGGVQALDALWGKELLGPQCHIVRCVAWCGSVLSAPYHHAPLPLHTDPPSPPPHHASPNRYSASTGAARERRRKRRKDAWPPHVGNAVATTRGLRASQMRAFGAASSAWRGAAARGDEARRAPLLPSLMNGFHAQPIFPVICFDVTSPAERLIAAESFPIPHPRPQSPAHGAHGSIDCRLARDLWPIRGSNWT